MEAGVGVVASREGGNGVELEGLVGRGSGGPLGIIWTATYR